MFWALLFRFHTYCHFDRRFSFQRTIRFRFSSSSFDGRLHHRRILLFCSFSFCRSRAEKVQKTRELHTHSIRKAKKSQKGESRSAQQLSLSIAVGIRQLGECANDREVAEDFRVEIVLKARRNSPLAGYLGVGCVPRILSLCMCVYVNKTQEE